MFAAVDTRPHFHPRIRLPFVVALVLLALTTVAGPVAAAPPGVASGVRTAPTVAVGSVNDSVFQNLSILPGGTSATITFITRQPVRAGATYAVASTTNAPVSAVVNAPVAAQPVTGAAPTVRAPIGNSAGFTGFVTPLSTSHTITLTGLKSNTIYTANVWIADDTGQQAQSVTLTFHTPKRRIRITFPKADIIESGQLIGNPNALWLLDLKWAGGEVGTCYPYSGTLCQPGDTGDQDNFGQYYFTNARDRAVGYLFLEEDFGNALPTAFTIQGAAETSDWQDIFDLSFLGSSFTPGSPQPPVWQVPQGGESTVQTLSIMANDDNKGFESNVQVKLEVFYDDLSYAGSKTVADTIGGKRIVTLFT